MASRATLEGRILSNTFQVHGSVVSLWERVLADDTLKEIRILTKDSYVMANSTLLSFLSEPFKAMFTHNMTERSTHTINMTDYSSAQVKFFLRLAFTGLRNPREEQENIKDEDPLSVNPSVQWQQDPPQDWQPKYVRTVEVFGEGVEIELEEAAWISRKIIGRNLGANLRHIHEDTGAWIWLRGGTVDEGTDSVLPVQLVVKTSDRKKADEAIVLCKDLIKSVKFEREARKLTKYEGPWRESRISEIAEPSLDLIIGCASLAKKYLVPELFVWMSDKLRLRLDDETFDQITAFAISQSDFALVTACLNYADSNHDLKCRFKQGKLSKAVSAELSRHWGCAPSLDLKRRRVY